MQIRPIFPILLSILFGAACKGRISEDLHPPITASSPIRNPLPVSEAKAYAQSKGFDTTLCLLIDMGRHSGLKRFFVIDLIHRTVLDSGRVSHGCGTKPWGRATSRQHPVFSNTPDSHCSSLGHYRIGRRGVSQWGIKVNYLLHGLDSTNNQALNRFIVLHSWERISEQEIWPYGTTESWGCPAVSNEFMIRLDSVLRDREKSVLLWMYR